MRRIVLAVCVTIMGAISVGAGASHVAAAGGSYPSRHHHGDYDLWAESTLYPNQSDPCFFGDASLCPSTGSFDYYAHLEGPAKVAGPPDYVDLYCATITVSGGYLHQDWTELLGPDTSLAATLTSLRGLGAAVQPGPTATHGSTGLMIVSAAGSWSDPSGSPPSSFTGRGSATGAYTTGPQYPYQGGAYGHITSGKIHISITGTLSHWVRPVTDKGGTWVANPTTQGTMTCDITPNPLYTDAYVSTSAT